MHILACGSRGFTDKVLATKILKDLDWCSCRIKYVLHGDCRGADRIAGQAAKDLGLAVQTMPADWERYGKSAGFRRNEAMMDTNPGLVLAFWDGESKGTAHTIGLARKRGIPVHVEEY